MNTTTKQPVLKIEPPRSKVKGSIWLNDGEKGPYYTVNISRSYKTFDKKEKKEVWKNTSSFRQSDLELVVGIAQEAMQWIDSQDQPTTQDD